MAPGEPVSPPRFPETMDWQEQLGASEARETHDDPESSTGHADQISQGPEESLAASFAAQEGGFRPGHQQSHHHNRQYHQKLDQEEQEDDPNDEVHAASLPTGARFQPVCLSRRSSASTHLIGRESALHEGFLMSGARTKGGARWRGALTRGVCAWGWLALSVPRRVEQKCLFSACLRIPAGTALHAS